MLTVAQVALLVTLETPTVAQVVQVVAQVELPLMLEAAAILLDQVQGGNGGAGGD